MRNLSIYLLTAFVAVLSASSAYPQSAANLTKQRADEFASHGAEATLKECNLPISCGGKPFVKEERERRETSNDVVVDQRTLHFDGLDIELWYTLEYPPGKPIQNPYQQPPAILSVSITGPMWTVANGLRIGVTTDKVAEVLGGSGIARDGCVEYVNDSKQDSVTLCFKANRLSSIHWQPWND